MGIMKNQKPTVNNCKAEVIHCPNPWRLMEKVPASDCSASSGEGAVPVEGEEDHSWPRWITPRQPQDPGAHKGNLKALRHTKAASKPWGTPRQSQGPWAHQGSLKTLGHNKAASRLWSLKALEPQGPGVHQGSLKALGHNKAASRPWGTTRQPQGPGAQQGSLKSCWQQSCTVWDSSQMN